ncbi:MAG: T9SS type A sorting domain-containing protein [Bacteroidales bacterium]|nr:T9SS type A sorting domain-containing protein [Bacteroidales bacterium]
MKKIYFIVLIVLLGVNAHRSQAQISKGGFPLGLSQTLSLEGVDQKIVQPNNFSDIIKEDNENEKIGVVFRYGVWANVDAGIHNSGTWTVLPNGQRIWRMIINAPGALAISVDFDKFRLPAGAKLFIYNDQKDHVIGAFDQDNNHESLEFATELVKGEKIIIEYIEPALQALGFLERRNATDKEKEGLGDYLPLLNVSKIIYAYRNVGFLFPDLENDAEKSCMVGINCSPEGTNWQNQKRGAARVSVVDGSGAGWCSGTLVNNAAQNCTPYFLLADHCGGTATTYMNQWVFYFNYEASSSSCQSETGSTTQSMTGATFKARGPESGGSDFLLLQLNQAVPASYNVYYCGWNRGTSASPSGVSIHHPGGRVKKISTYTTALQSYTWSGGATNAHWLVYWAQTTNGFSVTAGGSSGSPIFDNNGRVIGTLTGGGSYCTQTGQPDMYGKMSYHWESNGTADNRRLKPWLDPNNATTLDGRGPCGTTPSGLVCTSAVNLTCGQTYNGTTVGGASNVTTYSCQSWSESGPEKVHKIVTTTTGTITATLSNLGSNDLDVFIVNSCSESACVASGDLTASYPNAPAGTYYIVVDGYNGVSGTYTLNVTCSGGTTPSGCDTITNVGSSEQLTYYGFQSQWGYTSGHNGYTMTKYADKYTNTGTKYIKHAWIPVAKAYAGSGSSNVIFRAWNGSSTLPGAVLGSKTVAINTLTAGQWTLIDFTTPIPVTGNFFFGFEINYSSPQDTFAVYTATHRASGPNTAYAFYNSAWDSFESIYSGNLNTSLGMEPVVCTTTDFVENNADNNIRIFPNPANNMIAVQMEGITAKVENISIFDILGQKVAEMEIPENSHTFTVNLEDYKSGLYFISVNTLSGKFINKFSVIK